MVSAGADNPDEAASFSARVVASVTMSTVYVRPFPKTTDTVVVPTSWAHYTPTRWDYMLYAGTFGLFLTAFLLFLRFVPMISMFEVKTLLPQGKVKAEH